MSSKPRKIATEVPAKNANFPTGQRKHFLPEVFFWEK